MRVEIYHGGEAGWICFVEAKPRRSQRGRPPLPTMTWFGLTGHRVARRRAELESEILKDFDENKTATRPRKSTPSR